MLQPVSSVFLCFVQKLGLYLVSLQSLCLFYDLSKGVLLFFSYTRVGTIYLQLIQNRYMFRSFTVLQCSPQHCVQPVASDVEVVGYL